MDREDEYREMLERVFDQFSKYDSAVDDEISELNQSFPDSWDDAQRESYRELAQESLDAYTAIIMEYEKFQKLKKETGK